MDTTHFLIDIKTMAPDRNGVIYEISFASSSGVHFRGGLRQSVTIIDINVASFFSVTYNCIYCA